MFKLNYLMWFILMLMFSLSFFYMGINFGILDYMVMVEYKLMYMNSVGIYYTMIFDWISLIFISVVLFISCMVILYSMEYMPMGNYMYNRFLLIVILFIFSMFLMIISPNLLSIMLGWDGLGLVSYCLVIYYGSMKSYLAGMITCLTNRLGDIGLLICISWMFSYGSWHFMFYSSKYFDTMFYIIIISCFTKSAQIPFSCWLPAAMAAPTPVSSLVHSSTLVTAGVYLLIRFSTQINMNNNLFLFLSIMTMMMASFCANYEFDLKKIIALSTLSQLGLMMTSLFMGMKDLCLLHLLTHAMFKSLLFLCAGILIYYMFDNQDIRLMGSISLYMPMTISCFNVSNMALCGIPFLSGFYSKDLILESSISMNMNFFIYILMYMSLGMTVCYSVRLLYYSTFYMNKFISLSLIYDELKFMKLSIFILSFFSIIFGCSIMWMVNLDLSLLMFPMIIKLLSMIMVFMGIWVGLESMMFNYMFMYKYYLFNSYMWFMFSYSYYMYSYMYNFSLNYSKVNMMWGEYYGALGISYFMLKISNYLQVYSMNSLKVFFISFIIWMIFMI